MNGDPQRLKLEAELAALSKDIETKVASAFVAFQDVIELDAEHVGSRTGMLLLMMFRGQRPEVNEHLSVLRTLAGRESAGLRRRMEPLRSAPIRPMLSSKSSNLVIKHWILSVYLPSY